MFIYEVPGIGYIPVYNSVGEHGIIPCDHTKKRHINSLPPDDPRIREVASYCCQVTACRTLYALYTREQVQGQQAICDLQSGVDCGWSNTTKTKRSLSLYLI